MQIPLNALRAFEAVVKTGSFKAAADLLFVTQSAVSHQIRHLEDWLGGPLFDRAGGRPSTVYADSTEGTVLGPVRLEAFFATDWLLTPEATLTFR